MVDKIDNTSRPEFPKRAVITGGMPYGNKDLHFGHIGGVFVPADIYARFLRDRIGYENVIFVSGTDCYGSPIVNDYNKVIADGSFKGSLEDYITRNHKKQRDTIEKYNVQLNLFAASSLDPAVTNHKEISDYIIKSLYENGHLEKRTTRQFYDPESDTFLNGRQVTGRCPVYGCKSESAYADECSLGHQYEPEDLIAPKSAMTGETPVMKDVTNWYIKTPEFQKLIEQWVNVLEASGKCREVVIRTIREYLAKPTFHVTRKQVENLEPVLPKLPEHEYIDDGKPSVRLLFNNLTDRDTAKIVLRDNDVLYRSEKCIVPFRLTGNLDWGLPVPEIDGLDGLTFWVWPESLWAPISFTKTFLENTDTHKDNNTWQDWWCSPDTAIYQFIGEDNIYFYALPELAIFTGTQGSAPQMPAEGQLQLPTLIANHHLLFMNTKASSSSKVKPPLAFELLDHYTADQLRMHFNSLGLGMKNVSFQPKPYNPKATERDPDPVLKEGNLLCNAFNKAVRSCFYTAQKFYDCQIPANEISDDVIEICNDTILKFERDMQSHEFHKTTMLLTNFIREMNKRWSASNPFYDSCEEGLRKQTLVDVFHMVLVATKLLHPIAPKGTELIEEYLNLDKPLWDWDMIFSPVQEYISDLQTHKFKEVPPKFDFFEKEVAPN